jgi:hypothetical protein
MTAVWTNMATFHFLVTFEIAWRTVAVMAFVLLDSFVVTFGGKLTSLTTRHFYVHLASDTWDLLFARATLTLYFNEQRTRVTVARVA